MLVDSEPLSVATLAEALRRIGFDIDEAGIHRRFLGKSVDALMDEVRAHLGGHTPENFIADWHRHLFERMDGELRPCPGVPETLEMLPVPFCLASSSSPERIKRSLTAAGLDRRFDGCAFSASQVARGKPAPDVYLYAASRMGAAPANCLVVEDSLPGIAAGLAAGMRIVGFAGGSHMTGEMERDIRDTACLAVIRDMRELLPILASDLPET